MTHPSPIYPPALKKGDTIGVIAPSSFRDTKKLQPSVDYLSEQGFNVVFHPQTALKNGQFAGTPEQKVAALHDYFKDPNIKAIFCTCGGNGAIHLLDKIDYKLIAKNPKIFMGFSDVTVLLNAINAKTNLVTFHGPTMSRIDKVHPKWPQQMLDVLMGKTGEIPLEGKEILEKGNMEGTLFGGNLSVLQTLIGTSCVPRLDESIMFIEDTNDFLSRYDRMLGHMKQAGWLDSLSGIILGEFIKTHDNKDRPLGFTIEEILQTHAPNLPILSTDAPIGHSVQLCTLPIGANIALKDNKLSFKSLT
jgi:muramoyltetrapeptide carboxypeptidase